MTKLTISSSVGQNAVNAPKDLTAIEQRLIKLGFHRVPDYRKLDNGSLPASQLGFFSRERVLEQADQYDWGTSWLADFLVRTAEYYKTHHLEKSGNQFKSLILCNDASLPFGGANPGHKGHQNGLTLDMPLPWKDGRAYQGGLSSNDSRFDADTLKAMIQAMQNASKNNGSPSVDRVLFTWAKGDWKQFSEELKREQFKLSYDGKGVHKNHIDLKSSGAIHHKTQPNPRLFKIGWWNWDLSLPGSTTGTDPTNLKLELLLDAYLPLSRPLTGQSSSLIRSFLTAHSLRMITLCRFRTNQQTLIKPICWTGCLRKTHHDGC